MPDRELERFRTDIDLRLYAQGPGLGPAKPGAPTTAPTTCKTL